MFYDGCVAYIPSFFFFLSLSFLLRRSQIDLSVLCMSGLLHSSVKRRRRSTPVCRQGGKSMVFLTRKSEPYGGRPGGMYTHMRICMYMGIHIHRDVYLNTCILPKDVSVLFDT